MLKILINGVVACVLCQCLMCFAQPVLPTHDYQLTAKSQPIAKVLTDAAKIAQVTIHYLGSENNVISVSCHATSAQRFLQCVLKPGANSVFRYGLFEQCLVLSEVWVYSVGAGSFSALDETVNPHDDSAEQLIDAALSAEHVMFRESAMAELADSYAVDEQRKAHLLKEGLSDSNGRVRAQALAGLVKQAGYNADSELNAALADDDVDVRLMAVDQASTNPALLQKALQDTDATVRQYAAYKLSELVPSSN